MNNVLCARLINVLTYALVGVAVLMSGGGEAAAAPSQVVARVSIEKQRMEVVVDGRTVFDWKVSTGTKGYRTPKGSYKPTRMHKMWYSR